MEFSSSIWFCSFSSLTSLLFLTTGIYCLDISTTTTTISLPPHHHWFLHQIQACIASSVIFSISYAFLFRPSLENQHLFDPAPKLIIFYGLFHPQLIKSLLKPFFSIYTFFGFHDMLSLILPLLIYLPADLWFSLWSLKYFKATYNGNGNLLARIASPLLLYPYHSLCWVCFIVFLFFSLCLNFEDKLTLIFPSRECFSIWGLNDYISSVLQHISILSVMVFLKMILMPKSPFLNYAYEQRKMFEIILDLVFVILSNYFSREKSLPLMFAFLSFAITWLGNLANVQPRTDLGIFHFFVSSSMECAVSLFGIHVYTFLVLCGCIVLEILRWKIESVSLRHNGMREDVFLDWIQLGQPRNTPAVVAGEGSEPSEGKNVNRNLANVQ